MDIALTINELYRFFDFFNNEFFSNKLEKPVILIQTNGRHKNVLGWCTTNKIWNDKARTENYFEITICAEYLNRHIHEIIGTMIHEMVHLHNLQVGIKDVSRGGSYHNKKFKQVAEEKGLIIEFSKKIGWSLTTLQESTKALIDELSPSEELFKVARNGGLVLSPTDDEDEGEGEKPKSSSRKYICPSCESIVRATKDVNIICADCNEKFELEVK